MKKKKSIIPSIVANLFYHGLFIAMALSIIESSKPNEIAVLYIWFGILGLYVASLIWVFGADYTSEWRKYSSLIAVLKAINIPITIRLFFSSILFLDGGEGNSFLLMGMELSTTFKIHLALLTYSTFSLFTVGCRFTVKDNTITIVNGKIYYPNETFMQWPLWKQEKYFFDEKYTLPRFSISLQCTEGEFFVDVYMVEILLCLEIAKNAKIRNLDTDLLKKQAVEKISQEIKERAKTLTYKQFMTQQAAEFLTEVATFPISWSGKAKFISSTT